MALAPGTHLGPYEIQSAIGAGSMGEVYRARDTRLNRDVAVKVLPEQFALDADRLARFRREAQVLASLNHPNIAAIHGIEEADGTCALVLEFVDGPTLADRIAQGPIPLDETLPIARQITDALEAAHEQGIVHRDLKPANIKVRPDGTVKVLDFGLAKALEGNVLDADMSHSPTLTHAGTRLGVILGTPVYMAPEQARGKAVDERADIWAFGCVVYELLTGRKAFDAGDAADAIVAVMTREPDWNVLPAETPAALRKVLRRCLTKDARRRPQHAGDVRLEIEDLLRGGNDEYAALPPAGTRTSRRWPNSIRLTAGLLIGLLSAGGFYWWREAPAGDSAAAAVRLGYRLPDNVEIGREF